MTDQDQLPEEVQEYVEDEMQPTDEPDPITEGQFDAEVRNLIDLAIQSGVDPDHVEDALRHHADGVEYYYQDAIRYTQNQE